MIKTKFFDNPKRAFWEALVIAGAIFLLGILIGVSFEDSKLNKIDQYYALSEISLMDSIALGRIADLNVSNCLDLIKNDVGFADRIYNEALLLEKYESSGQLTDSLALVHKKYDVLRTVLWINVMKTREKCSGNFNSVVYLYNYETENLEEKAKQTVWSRILFDLKQQEKDKIILIPIAANNNISSLDSITQRLGISRYPAVIVNEKDVLYDITSVNDIKKYLG